MSVNVVDKVDDQVKIKRVLISVSDKAGLDKLIPGLLQANPRITFYSTGGTYAAIEKILGKKAAKRLVAVSDYTGQPETQGGLVKTLDFKIYLGLLTETYNKSHRADLKRTGAQKMDMVVVNLYPFKETIAKRGTTVEQARSNIDIGGPTMIRAAAKNYLRVAPVVNPADYGKLIKKLKKNDGKLSLADRFELACTAFAHTAEYDSTIAKYLAAKSPKKVAAIYNLK
jgi:phosphoribosylaminoimidazolecarboxamide formyltransferase / IMP cyclohydrolase